LDTITHHTENVKPFFDKIQNFFFEMFASFLASHIDHRNPNFPRFHICMPEFC
jgi:hypothetical protein